VTGVQTCALPISDDNIMEINGGGNGTFYGVTEAFYDRMVNIFSNNQY